MNHKRIIALAFLPLVSVCMARPVSAQRLYEGIQYLKPAPRGEERAKPINGVLRFDGSHHQFAFYAKDGTALTVPYDEIWKLLYERTSRPKYLSGLMAAWPLLFKGRKHFLTIQYADAGETGQFAVFQLNKDKYREILDVCEKDTGKKIEHFRAR